MSQIHIVVNVHGGVVQDVFCSHEARVTVVDWDDEGYRVDDPQRYAVPDGRRQKPVHVGTSRARPFSRLSRTDVEAALKAAGVAYGPA